MQISGGGTTSIYALVYLVQKNLHLGQAQSQISSSWLPAGAGPSKQLLLTSQKALRLCLLVWRQPGSCQHPPCATLGPRGRDVLMCRSVPSPQLQVPPAISQARSINCPDYAVITQ